MRQAIASEVVNPDMIDVRLADVGGLENIIKSLVHMFTCGRQSVPALAKPLRACLPALAQALAQLHNAQT